MIRFIKEAIGIRTTEQKEEFVPTFKTTEPKERLSFNDWCISFKVGSCYGKDARYFG
jgi:hypothetical protein